MVASIAARVISKRSSAISNPIAALEHLVRFGQDPRIVCLSRLANTLWFLGAATDDAGRVRDEALAMAVDVGHPFSRGVVFVFAAILCVDLGDLDGFRRVRRCPVG